MKHIIRSCFKPKNHLPAIDHESTTHGNQKRLSVCDIGGDRFYSLSANDLSSNSVISSNLHIFTLSELRVITGDFSAANFLGERGFGPVHKGFIDDETRIGLAAQPAHVMRLDLLGHQQWLIEVIILAQLKHPHLVKLIGYCWEGEERLLVYEYMERGTLESHLFGNNSTCLPWLTRIKIAVGAAKGLAFLHEVEKQVVYRYFNSSNILLDSDYTGKLYNFEQTKDVPQGDSAHFATCNIGPVGYVDPAYIMSGHLTSMSDVYSFGIVLLELISGKRVTDMKKPTIDEHIVEWVKPFVKDSHKLDKIIDMKLECQYSTEGAKRVVALAYECLSVLPKNRPTMNHVVKRLEHVFELQDVPIERDIHFCCPIRIPKGAQ